MTTIHDLREAVENVARITDAWGSNRNSLDAGAVSSLSDADICDIDAIVARFSAAQKRLHCIRVDLLAAANSVRPVNQLPDEILRMVFAHHAYDDGYLYVFRGHNVPHPTSILASVCSRWRALALGNPALWTRINVTTSTFQLNTLRTRFGELPLYLAYRRQSTCSTTKVLSFLQHTFTQVKSLVLDDLSPYDSDPVTEFLMDGYAPRLEECVAFSNGADWSQPLFANGAPRLRHLELIGITLPWSKLLFKNLLTLVVTLGQIVLPIGMDICDVLRASPGLDILQLEIPRRDLDDTLQNVYAVNTSPCEPRASLANLRILRLRLPLACILHIFSSIAMPSVRILELRLPDILNDDESRLLSSLFSPGMPSAAVFQAITHFKVVLSRQDHDLHPIFEGFAEDGSMVFFLEWEDMTSFQGSDVPAVHSVTSNLCENYLAPTIRKLTLESSFHQCDHPLMPLLHLQSLRALTLKGHRRASVLCAEFLLEAALALPPELDELELREFSLDEDALAALVEWSASAGHALSTTRLVDLAFDVASQEHVRDALRDMRRTVTRVEASCASCFEQQVLCRCEHCLGPYVPSPVIHPTTNWDLSHQQ